MKKLTKFALGAAGAAVAAGAGVMALRALKFRPAPELRADPDEVEVDYDRVVESLREMIRFRTVSSDRPEEEDAAEFDKFRAYLLERYPTLAEKCGPERIGRRGALDTKVTLCAIMEAAERLISSGFTPENDIYLAFSGEEEPAGPSAGDIVTALEERGVRPALVLD